MFWIGLTTFISGFAGLIYEVMWIRLFGNGSGNTIYSSALVMAIFMSGLGLGSFAAGLILSRKIDLSFDRLKRIYATIEIGICALSILISLFLVRIDSVTALFSTYSKNTISGWNIVTTGSMGIRIALAISLLWPITFLMGATLPVLVRLVFLRRNRKGNIGFLYGLNTAGAALGAFFTDQIFVPQIGIQSTLNTAALCSLLSALLVFKLKTDAHSEMSGPKSAETSPCDANKRTILSIGGATFCFGFLALGLEIIWIRFLITGLGTDRGMLSSFLFILLICIGAGSLAAAFLRKIVDPRLAMLTVQSLMILFMLLLFASYTPWIPRWHPVEFGISQWRMGAVTYIFERLYCILLLIGIPCFLTGAGFSFAYESIHASVASSGKRFGFLYLANSFGSIFGSILTGFFFIQYFGIQRSILILGITGFLGLVLTCISLPKFVRPLTVSCLMIVTISLMMWGFLPKNHFAEKLYLQGDKKREVFLAFSEGLTETIAIKDEGGLMGRLLLTNNHRMSSNGVLSQRYMRWFVHFPLLQIQNPSDVLVICFGVGNTLDAVTAHPSVKNIEIADLSENILAHSSYFFQTNHRVLENPRVSVFVNDGRQHLRMQPEAKYDLVTLEPPPLPAAGTSSLYSKEFYSLVKSRLKKGGYITQWLPYHQVPGTVLRSIIRSFLDIYPEAVLLSGDLEDFILVGRTEGKIEFNPADIKAAIQSRPLVARDLDLIKLPASIDQLGTFVGDAKYLEIIADAAPMVDDWPIMEYSIGTLNVSPWPGGFTGVGSILTFCPACFSKGIPLKEFEGINTYLKIQGKFYDHIRFNGPPELFKPIQYANEGEWEEMTKVAAKSEYLKFLMRQSTWMKAN